MCVRTEEVIAWGMEQARPFFVPWSACACVQECVWLCQRMWVRVDEWVDDFVREMRGIYVRKNVCFLCPGCICASASAAAQEVERSWAMPGSGKGFGKRVERLWGRPEVYGRGEVNRRRRKAQVSVYLCSESLLANPGRANRLGTEVERLWK